MGSSQPQPDAGLKRIAVIGGGIAGLSAAVSLQNQKNKGAALEYVIFEAGSRWGGVIQTESIDGCLIEAGPDSFLTEKAWAADFSRELGLADQLISSNDADRKTWILLRGRLTPLPDGMMFMVPTKIAPVFSSPLFSWKTRLRILREWFYRPSATASEATVAEFIARHYGREMVERIADPLLAGVYGGAADELSVQAVLPRLAEMEASYGSLGKAMLSARRLADGRSQKPLFTSLKDGMQQLADAALSRIPESSRRLNSPVEQVSRESNKWLLIRSGRTEEFDGVIVATPAHATSQLLRAEPALVADLQTISYSSSVTVALIYGKAVRDALPPGFGFLVPRMEGRRILAVTFVHNKFPHRAPADRAVVRCFLGGSRDGDILAESDDSILEIVRQELRRILGVEPEPMAARIYRWPSAMAQYAIGHNDRIKRIRDFAGNLPGLALAGNAYSGIGVPDCIRTGAEAAGKVLKDTGIESRLAPGMLTAKEPL